MEIRIESFFGVTEIALLPVPQIRLACTTVGDMVHWSLDGEVMVTVDQDAQRILYAHRSVTVVHTFEGREQRFQGICAA